MRWLKALALLLALTLTSVATLIGWLMIAPLPLDFAKTQIEAALPALTPGLSWRIGGVDLSWSGWNRGVRLRARGVRLFEENGNPILSLPAFGLRLAVVPLLRGEVRVRAIDVRGPKVHLRRAADNSISVGVSSKKNEPNESSPMSFAGALQYFLEQDAEKSLRRISITGAEVAVDDQKLGASWYADGGRINIGRRGGDLLGDLTLTLHTAQEPIALRAGVTIEAGSAHRFDIAVDADQVPVNELASLWPSSVAQASRRWVTSNVTEGRVLGAQAELRGHFSPGVAPAGAIELVFDELVGGFKLEGTSVRYLDTMPPVTGVQARSQFTLDGLVFEVEAGTLQTIAVGPGQVRITGLARDRPRLAIEAAANGAVAKAIEVLQSRPLELATKMKVDPAELKGTFRARVGFDFPLRSRIDSSKLGMKITASVADGVMPGVLDRWNIDDGDLEVEVNDRQLHVWGPARLEGVALEGDWLEHLERGSDLEREVKISTKLDSQDRRALGFDIGEWFEGQTPVELVLTQPREQDAEIRIHSDLTQARIDRPLLGLHKQPGTPATLQATLISTKGEINAIKELTLSVDETEIHASAARSDGYWRSIDASGRLGGAPFEFSLTPSGANEKFAFQSPDASALLKSIGLFSNGDGGALDVQGTVEVARPNLPFAAKLSLRKITVRKAPFLARILGLASFSGVKALVTGKGLRFKKIEADLSGDQDVIELSDGTAAGKTLGMLMAGKIDRRAADVDLRGTVIPDYYGVNRLFGTELLALSFTVKGKFENPEVALDPLRTLQPRILKKMAEALESDEQPDAE